MVVNGDNCHFHSDEILITKNVRIVSLPSNSPYSNDNEFYEELEMIEMEPV